MNCKKIQSRIPGFLKDDLEKQEAEEIFKHVNECVDCRMAYQDIRQAIMDSKPNPPISNS